MGYVSDFSTMLKIVNDMQGKTVKYDNTTIDALLSQGIVNIHPLQACDGLNFFYEAIYRYTYIPGEYETAKGYTVSVLAAVNLAQNEDSVVISYVGVATSILFADFCQMVGTAAGLIQLRYPSADDIGGYEPTSYVKLAGLYGLAYSKISNAYLNATVNSSVQPFASPQQAGDCYVPVIITKQSGGYYCLVDETSVNDLFAVYRKTGVWEPSIVPKTRFETHKESMFYPCDPNILDDQIRYGATYNDFTYFLDENERKAVQVAWNAILAKYRDVMFTNSNIWYGSRLFMKDGQYVKEVRISVTQIPNTVNPDRLFTCEIQGDGNIFLYFAVGSGYNGRVHNFRVPVSLNEGGWYDQNGEITYTTSSPGSYIRLTLNNELVSGFGEMASRDIWVHQDQTVDPPDGETDTVESRYPNWHNAGTARDMYMKPPNTSQEYRSIRRFIPLTPFWSSWNVFNPDYSRARSGLIASDDLVPNMTTSDSYNKMIADRFVYYQDAANPGSQGGGGSPGSGGDPGGDPGTGGGSPGGGGIFDLDDPFAPGGSSPGETPGGGDQPGVGGSTEDVPDSGKVDEPPTTDFGGVSAGLYNCYMGISIDKMTGLNKWLWSTSVWDTLVKYFSKPLEAVLSFGLIYVDPPSTSFTHTEYVNMGNLSYPLSCQAVTNQYVTLDCGTILINSYHDNAMDYEPFTRISAYLPFVGFVDWPTADVMNSQVNIKYQFDVVSGSGLCYVYVKREGNGFSAPLYAYDCNCLVSIPLSGSDFSRFYSALASAAVAVGAGVVSGGATAVAQVGATATEAVAAGAQTVGRALGGIKAGTEGVLNTITSGVSTVQQGRIGAVSGGLGPRKPFLIIRRSQPYMPVNYQAFQGFPANESVTLGSVSGFTRVREVHVSGVNATDEELDLIESILKEGVFV